PFQLVLELFEEESPPDGSATAPACVLGCLGGTPTYNGQLFDHAMPTGYIYKLWLLAGDPMYFEDKNTQCMQFDFEYSLKFESKMTPFEVTSHSWMCPFARLPGLIVQLKKDAEDAIMSDELGVVKMHFVDLKGWFGFPPDELDSMVHTTRLVLQQPRLAAALSKFLEGQLRVTEDAQFVLDTKYGVPTSGHHLLRLSVPRRSLLKLSVRSSSGTSPHLVVYPEGQPAAVLAEAYGDLFMEADSAGLYVIRLTLTPAASSASCPFLHFHFVVAPLSLIPVCPWARGLQQQQQQQQLSLPQLRQAALNAFNTTFDASMFLPKQLGADGVEVSRPHDIWMSPSLQPEFPFSAPGASSSAVSEYTENRILLLSRDLPGGDYILKFVIYDQAQPETEQLCAHATINAELGENNSALLNAVRAELLEVPDLLPVEPLPRSFNSRC
ncbi:hypothetical protein ETH_00014930, partial [Eimeria tenella]